MARHFAASAFTLKVVAIAGMTCNHVANVFAAQLPGWCVALLCTFGGLTFPIMAFLLNEGYRHTSDVRRYAIRLGGFALVSQIPYSLLWGATANVLVTLLIGLGLLWADDHLRNRMAYGAIVVAAVVASSFCDWGIIGPIMIMLFHGLRNRPHGVVIAMLVPLLALGLPAAQWAVEEASAAAGGAEPTITEQLMGTTRSEAAIGELAVESPEAADLNPQSTRTVDDAAPLAASLGTLGYYTIGFGIATALMASYRGRRGRPLKWFFYVYYPGHLFALWALSTALC